MKAYKTEKIPIGISDYITDHYREDFLFEVKQVVVINGKPTYIVEVSKDNEIHRLKFDEHGRLLKDDVEEAFPPDMHEERSFDVPE